MFSYILVHGQRGGCGIQKLKYEVLMKVNTNIMGFWGVTPCSLIDMYESLEDVFMFRVKPDDGGSMLIRNVGICVPDYTVSHSVICRENVIQRASINSTYV
jgi:hypothetical protein